MFARALAAIPGRHAAAALLVVSACLSAGSAGAATLCQRLDISLDTLQSVQQSLAGGGSTAEASGNVQNIQMAAAASENGQVFSNDSQVLQAQGSMSQEMAGAIASLPSVPAPPALPGMPAPPAPPAPSLLGGCSESVTDMPGYSASVSGLRTLANQIADAHGVMVNAATTGNQSGSVQVDDWVQTLDSTLRSMQELCGPDASNVCLPPQL